MKRRHIIAFICFIVALSGSLAVVHHESQHPTQAHAVKPSQAAAQQPASPTTFDRTTYSVTDPNSIWVVVNKQRPLSSVTYTPSDLTSVGNGQVMRASAATALTTMFADARKAGLTLSAASAYRSYTTQVSVYNKEVADYGQKTADSESARPGYSEHQTGLAVDIAGGGCSITDCFGNTAEGKWAAANAYKYGFILRYPSDKTAITGYRTESWHFRYVGTELATELHKQHVETLEEFFELGAAPDYK